MAQQRLRKPKAPVPSVPGQLPLVNKNFREFEGVNTQAARQAIKPTQFYWLENLMPIGHGNLRVVKQVSGVLQTLAATAYYSKSYFIGTTNYMFYACSNGSAYQVLLDSPYTITEIAPAGTLEVSGVQIAQWKTERILLITTKAPGYYSWDGASLTVLGGTTSAPTAGTTIATFSGRVWIGNSRTINYSDAGSYVSFGNDGGNTVIADESFVGEIGQLLSANNFLYVVSGDSINVIADVQVVGGVTQFSNTNISANSGTEFPQSIFAYYRAIWYLNRDGIFGLYGATPRKASDDLDGIFQRIDFTQPITGGTVSIYNILCASFMFTYNDPNLGARKVLACYFNKKWFIASQGESLRIMSSAHGHDADGVDSLFATDGTQIYELFNDEESDIDSMWQTALWDMDDFIREKQSMRLGIEVNVPGLGIVSPTVDTEAGSQPPAATFSGSFEFNWVNGSGVDFAWVNGVGTPFIWLAAGYQWLQGDVETYGHYLGVTCESSNAQIQYSGIQLQYRLMVANWGN